MPLRESLAKRRLQNMSSYGDQEVYERDGFCCAYCGFDGRSFHGWMQLTIDHVVPVSANGPDTFKNKVVACSACSKLTCRYVPKPDLATSQVFEEKRQIVLRRLSAYHELWARAIAPLIDVAMPNRSANPIDTESVDQRPLADEIP